MRVYHFPEKPGTAQYLMLLSDLMAEPTIHTGEWQAMNTRSSSAHATHEIEDVSLVWDRMPHDLDTIVPAIDHDWADEHFAERVSGHPLNPAPSHLRWPYAVRGNADHTRPTPSGNPRQREASRVGITATGPGVTLPEQFDHTYPERFWPKHASHQHGDIGTDFIDDICGGMPGVRFHYGDLDDVVNLLVRNPLTRQAYLPVWFPEDTGAVDGQRVPCTLGYHFMQRAGWLSCRYYMRSCEVYRHLSNDIYLAARLTRWITDQLWERTKDNPVKVSVRPGGLVMHISSLHAFVGDTDRINARMEAVSARGWYVGREPRDAH